jgi:hypothetical protein
MNRRRGYHPNRWVRTSHCPHTGKVRYPTDHAAERDMRRIQTQVLAEGRTHVPQETYACTECDGWHLTSEKRRDRLGAERAPSRPGWRARRQRWRRTLTVQLLLAEPWCPVRTTGCTGRASTIVPLSRPEDLAVPEAWLTVCVPCRDALTTPKET